MILIYTKKTSPRFLYIVNEIFKHHLKLEFKITSSLEDFIVSNLFKISYAESRIGNELFIKSTGLLFQKGISSQNINITYHQNIPCFFQTPEADIPLDLFSAAFFMLSRYEEYCQQSQHFDYKDTLAHKNNFLKIPVVDLWTSLLSQKLTDLYPSISLPPLSYKYTSVIEVERAFMYKAKGVIRSVGKMFLNLAKLNIPEIIKQYRVLRCSEKDPYDIYQNLLDFHINRDIDCIFFFSVADYSPHDKNISYLNQTYKGLIKYISDYRIVSVLGSCASVSNSKTMKTEKTRMGNIINRRIKRFRSNNNALLIPQTYHLLDQNEYREDYTMGFQKAIGFRAGTSMPFLFYDLSLETETSIMVHPFCIHSSSISPYNHQEILKEIISLKNYIQSVNGPFIAIFTNTFFADNKLENDSFSYKLIEMLTRK